MNFGVFLVLPVINSFFCFLLSLLLNSFWSVFCISLSSFFLFFWGFFLVLSFFSETLFIISDDFQWVELGLLSLNWGFFLDLVSIIMFFVVSVISSLVQLYSIEYMRYDPCLVKFLCYLMLFTCSMFILISAPNLVQLFLGWEGVGICSYLLINFWYTRLEANTSALKAVIMNRLGDCGLLFALAIIFYGCNTLDYDLIFLIIPFRSEYLFNIFGMEFFFLDLVCFFFLIGAFGKSAQLFFHTWLPDAMEGPTPVSALIHAATMVTAGIFLIIRLSFIFEYSETMLNLLGVFGGLTAFIAASCGLLQNDLKKIIAYSTCSQLGYMVFICSHSAFILGFFHLVTHAFFKALLFLSAGSIINGFLGEQDIRRMGGSFDLFSLTYISFFIGSLALLGFPFLSGFYSKDTIFEFIFIGDFLATSFFSVFITLSVIFTTFYSYRLLHYVFFSLYSGSRIILFFQYESFNFIAFVLIVLSVLSIFIGFFFSDLFIGFGSVNFQISGFYHNLHFFSYFFEFIPVFWKLIPFFLVICTLIFSFFVCFFRKDLVPFNFYFYHNFYILGINYRFFFFNKFLFQLYRFFFDKWLFDFIYNKFFFNFFFKLSFNFLKVFDRGFIESSIPLFFVKSLSKLGSNFYFFQSGFVFDYLLLIFYFVFFILLVFFF